MPAVGSSDVVPNDNDGRGYALEKLLVSLMALVSVAELAGGGFLFLFLTLMGSVG